MKTVRFGSVVETSGRPEVYLLLVDPKKDPEFQKALKADRVMTVHHAPGKTDFGAVGYDPDSRGQLLLFPRSLKKFAGARIVGLDYDLLDEEHESAKKIAPKAKSKPAARPKPESKTKSGPKLKPEPKEEEEKPAPAKVIPFTKPTPPEEEEEESEEVAELKAVIRRALKALELGKEVAAYNLLKKSVN